MTGHTATTSTAFIRGPSCEALDGEGVEQQLYGGHLQLLQDRGCQHSLVTCVAAVDQTPYGTQ